MLKERFMSIQKLTELIASSTNPQLALEAIKAAGYEPKYLSAATVGELS